MLKKILLSLAFLILIVGCGKKDDMQQMKNNGGVSTFTDSLGRKFELPKKLKRIAPSGRMAQVVLAGLAPKEMVVIAKKPSKEILESLKDFPKHLPEVGQFYGTKPNFNKEAVIKASPEVIIDIGDRKKNIKQDIEQMEKNTGVKVIFIEFTPETASKAYRMLGELLDKKEKAEKIAKFFDNEVKVIKEGLNKIPKEKRLTFIQIGGGDNLQIDPQNSSHTLSIEFAGGINKATASKKSDKQSKTEGMNKEEVLSWNPDIIFAKTDKAAKAIKEDPAFANMKAVKSNKIIVIPSDPYNFVTDPPSVNKMIGIYWAAQKMYPDIFKYDFEKLNKEFKELVY